MNLYEKLVASKTDLYKKGLKKSGENKFANYGYFELSDFLPDILACQAKYNYCCYVSYDKDLATLYINDPETGQEIRVTSPMSTAALKGMHDVQNLGAVQTYLRRYLYMSAFEIVESDAIETDAKPPNKTEPTTPKPAITGDKTGDKKITSDQYEELKKLCQGLDGQPVKTEVERLQTIYKGMGYKHALDILQRDYDKIKSEFEQLPF